MKQYIKSKYRKHLGIEIEFLICDLDGNYVFVDELLNILNNNKNLSGEFEMEAFKCTIEYVTPPCKNDKIAINTITKDMKILNDTLASLNLTIGKERYYEMPEKFFRTDNGELASTMKLAFGNVFTPSMHVHFGVGTLNEAVKVYNRWVNNYDKFKDFHNRNNKSKRQDKIMNINIDLNGKCRPHYIIKPFELPFRHFEYIDENDNLIYPFRYYYFLYTKHGTVENRVSDFNPDFNKLYDYIRFLYKISCESIQ